MKKQMIFALFTGICVLTQHGSEKNIELNYKQNPIVQVDNSHQQRFISASFIENSLQKHKTSLPLIRNMHSSLQLTNTLASITENVYQAFIKKQEENKKLQLYYQVASNAGINMNKDGSFHLKTTTYGMDCIGCSFINGQAKTALGVSLDMYRGVQLPDASWQSGIRYGKYYIIAADKNIPLCSIIKINEHGLSGSGLSPNVPFYAIVLDRGGGIYGNHIDLYIGLEDSKAIQKVENQTPVAEFIRIGGQQGNTCSLEDVE